MDLCEFEASLVFRASSRTGSKATKRNTVSKNQKRERFVGEDVLPSFLFLKTFRHRNTKMEIH